jgi:hypothetical protein
MCQQLQQNTGKTTVTQLQLLLMPRQQHSED